MSAAIGALVGIIFVLILLGVVWWAITQLLPLIPLPEPFARIIHVLLVVILVLIVLWVIVVLLGAAGIHVAGPFRSSLAGRTIAALSGGAAVDL
ncbi:MAG TPA: hypothetical protein VHT00_14195 [Stellaceae bacterium]|nr:hypothetical protein [Stellaceae bacterium]